MTVYKNLILQLDGKRQAGLDFIKVRSSLDFLAKYQMLSHFLTLQDSSPKHHASKLGVLSFTLRAQSIKRSEV
jgi:hypothetical protein